MLSISYIARGCGVLFPLLLCSLIMSANNRVHYGPMVASVFCASHLIIIIMQKFWTYCTSKILVRFYRVRMLSQLSHVAVCIRLTYISCADWENMCTLSDHKIGSMNHFPLFIVKGIKASSGGVCRNNARGRVRNRKSNPDYNIYLKYEYRARSERRFACYSHCYVTRCP